MKVLKISIIILIGIFFMFFIRELLFSIFVPDPCDYHNHRIEEGFIIRNFYYFSGYTGYHPEPNILNTILTIVLGIIVGFLFYLASPFTKKL